MSADKCGFALYEYLRQNHGSEYINYKIAALLSKLLIEFTKSRSRQTNDNALAESKNGSVIRKLFGYAHIPLRWASLINTFNHKVTRKKYPPLIFIRTPFKTDVSYGHNFTH